MQKAKAKRKAKLESDSMLHVKAMCIAASTSLRSACDEIGIPYKQTHAAFARDSYRGKAGERQRQVLRHLQAILRQKKTCRDTFYRTVRKNVRDRSDRNQKRTYKRRQTV